MRRRKFIAAGSIGGLAVVAGQTFASGDSESITAKSRLSHRGNGFLNGLRVWPAIWRNESSFGNLLRTLQQHPRVVSELALFDEFKHWAPSRPLDQVRDDLVVLERRLGTARDAGLAAGINVISTVGHGIHQIEDVMAHPPMVNHRGDASLAVACPRSESLRRYLADYYRLMAQTKPNLIWVDDDFRTVAGGVRYGCFCDRCLRAFGFEGSREDLVGRLEGQGGFEWRKRWGNFFAESMEEVLVLIRQTVRAVDPEIELGLMTVGYSLSTYAGYPIGDWMRKLGAERGRPGQGFYNDDEPRALIDKAMEVGRQVHDYPESVSRAQYELENWPYVTLDKSPRTVANEGTAALAMGCNGLLLNTLYE